MVFHNLILRLKYLMYMHIHMHVQSCAHAHTHTRVCTHTHRKRYRDSDRQRDIKKNWNFSVTSEGCIPVNGSKNHDICKHLTLIVCSCFLDLSSLSLSPWISPFIQTVKYLVQLYLILLTIITIKGLCL